MECILSTLARIPIIEFVLFIAWWFVTAAQWRGLPVEGPDELSLDERQLGATVIISEMTGILTACSIIITGIAAFAAILGSQPPAETAPHLGWAALYAVVALFLALWVMSALPARVTRKNVLRSKSVATICAIALYLSLIAGVRFVFGIWSFVLWPA
ncbi:hypothetical protein [Nitratireductor soli]|uniref:hypothetical protein n=1 Tax=Nitratireductor soli TaxID=1670619 RepID=UPI00065E64E3|nr:hypothetical protein [Nitratireductor soli]